MNAGMIAVLILVVSYAILFSEMLNRAIVALLGAGIMIIAGILSQKTAIEGIDFNTIFLLIGMMIIVGIAEKSGVFEYTAIRAVKAVKANPRSLMVVLILMTAFFSALLDNVTTILLIVPITFQITRQLQVSAYPYLLAEIFASNIGGAATLIGDPPNIIIGSALGLNFMDFVNALTPIVIIALLAIILIFDCFWGRNLSALTEQKENVMRTEAKAAIKDKILLIKSTIVLSFVIVAFIAAEHIDIENGTIALFGAAILLLLYSFGLKHGQREQQIEEAFNMVDWTTVFFFAGLFIIVHGLHETGVLQSLGNKFAEFTNGDILQTAMITLAGSAVLSTAIDNIPFVATMIPMLKSMEEGLGGREIMMPIWWALSLGACFGGNGSLIAASANVIAAGIATKEGEPIHFMKFLIWSLPITLLTIILSAVYLYFRYFYIWS